MLNNEQWNKWFAWHHDWKERRDETYKQIKRNYKGIERKQALEQYQKLFLQEFWDARKRILGN